MRWASRTERCGLGKGATGRKGPGTVLLQSHCILENPPTPYTLVTRTASDRLEEV